MQAPTYQGKESVFLEGKGRWEGSSKRGVHGFSLAESSPGKKSSLSSSYSALLWLHGQRALPSGLRTLLTEMSIY